MVLLAPGAAPGLVRSELFLLQHFAEFRFLAAFPGWLRGCWL